jgi:glutamyl-Q tRNA(Asp) synthetase
VRRQSEHMPDYEAALERLNRQGVLYRCFRTRRQIAEAAASAPHGPEEPWRGGSHTPQDEAERLSRGEPFAWRLSLDAARARLGEAYDRLTYTDVDAGEALARPDTAGDVVLAYHLASVVDDALQGVTHVIRGEDLREAVHVQRLLQALLGLPTPLYRHHRLILGPDGKRFAKRDGTGRLSELRANGVTAAGVRAMVGL